MSKRLVVWLSIVLLASPVVAQGEPQVFAASTTGEILIGADGEVVALTLERKSLGQDVMAAIDARVRGWRFQPLVEAGRPVQLKARLQLDMLAMRERGVPGMTLAIRNVQFLDPPGAGGAKGAHPAQARPKLQRPSYPASAVRKMVGGTVWLAVRVGPGGEVADVAAHAVELRTDRADGPARESSYAREFVRAAEGAAQHWLLPGHAGLVVVVPVMFRTGNDSGERWMRVHDVPIDVPAWVTGTDEAIVQLDEGGEPGSSRVQLLSAVD